MKTLLKALMCVLILSGAVKADSLITWDFSFYTVDQTTKLPIGIAIGSGTFQTGQVRTNTTPGYYQIFSLDGEMNGSPMSLLPTLYHSDGTPENNVVDAFGPFSIQYPFYFHQFVFSVEGVSYAIYDLDVSAPVSGNVLLGPNFISDVNLSVVQEPVSTPEASTVAMLLVGLGGLALAAYWKRKPSMSECGEAR